MSNPYVLIAYRNFMSKQPNVSHVGLGINSFHSVKCLRLAGIRADLAAVWTAQDVLDQIAARPGLTHFLIEAPFIDAPSIQNIISKYPEIQFSCRCHSQIAFLQVEAGSISLIREYIRIQQVAHNFNFSSNAARFIEFMQQVYGARVLSLPNLYFLDPVKRNVWSPPAKLIRCASFGAIRLMKNHITSAAAALEMASLYNKDLEFNLSINREENGGGVLQAIRNLFTGLPHARLIECPWSTWPQFLELFQYIDLHFQLSMSETYNITTCDAVASNVPTVVGEAIDWVPSRWVASIDDVEDAARVGWSLLNDPHAAGDGMTALQAYAVKAMTAWKAWLSA